MRQRPFVLFAALAITVAACGSDDDDSADEVSSAASEQTAVPVPSQSKLPATTSDGLSTASVPAETTADTTGPAGTVPAATDAPDNTEAADTVAESEAPDTVPPIADVPVSTQPLYMPATNPVTDPAVDALSTFAMDVDTGSYTYARGSLQSGVVPDPGAVRTEEFVNAQAQDYTAPVDGAFALTLDGTTAPFLPGHTRVVRVGVQGRTITDEDRADANLTFVVDISGSMAEPGKLDIVRPALRALVDALRPTDRVGIVVFSEHPRLLLSSTPASERQVIDGAIDQLQSESGTNVEGGLRIGYDLAGETLDPERINRVILLSDGVANVGATGPEGILEVIGDAAREGIDLVTVGFGLGTYNDRLMEQLADQGDGFYAYVDDEQEAEQLFREDLTGTLLTIARDAKVQVEFNPGAVSSYRLIGFENRALADDDFRDDTVDGGEVGAGHTVTALYEVTLHEGATAEDAWLARGVIRWLDPDTLVATELATTLLAADADGGIGDSSLRLQQDVYVAAFAETLRGSGWNGLMSLEGLSQNLHSLASRLEDESLQEVADLVDTRISLG